MGEHPANKHSTLLQPEFDKFCRPPRELPIPIVISLKAELEQRVLPKEEFFRQWRRESRKSVITPAEALAATSKADVRGNSGSPSPRGAKDRTVAFAEDDGQQLAMDLDDVWREFSPRLQNIVEEQKAEWTTDPKEHDDRLQMIQDANKALQVRGPDK